MHEDHRQQHRQYNRPHSCDQHAGHAPPPGTLTRRQWLAWLGTGGILAIAGPAPHAGRASTAAWPPMLAREAPAGIDPAGWLVSEKFDGIRALWDGERLSFRSGLPVTAPPGFLARLPREPLDGELWLGRGRFERLSGTVRKARPVAAEWAAVRYLVFDQPGTPGPFAERAHRLERLVRRTGWPALQAVAQERLIDRAALAARLQAVVRGGGEGLMLHRADAPWQPGRSEALLKLKPLHDAEATVLGHEPGRGRHAGRLGALRVRDDDGVEFRIGTGFSDAERDAPPPAGSRVTYTYRGRTERGVPRFASFLRVREAP
jgi:DNA ligase-1